MIALLVVLVLIVVECASSRNYRRSLLALGALITLTSLPACGLAAFLSL
jgi:hypothetical protein